MTNPGPTKEGYDSLVYKVATLEAELGQARRRLEAPAKKPSWWKRYLSGLAVVALVMVLVPGGSHALTDDQWALIWQKGVFVWVKNIDPKVVPLGLTRDQVKTDVELQLRKAGIRVLTERECRATPGHPYLSVAISISEIKISHDRVGYAYYIGLSLIESVMLARGFEAVGSIWSTGSVGAIGKDASPMRSIISGFVDNFINDYLAANPKK